LNAPQGQAGGSEDSWKSYRLLFDGNPQPMWVFDSQSLKILDVNRAAVMKYGYTLEEFLNMTIADIRPPEDLERLPDML